MTVAAPPQLLKVAVERIVRETPETRTFRLRFGPETDFSFLPGQFLMIQFPDEPGTSRAYSISSSPLEGGSVEICLNRAGRFTGKMFELQEGDLLLARGPFGKWTYQDDEPRSVLISGGTGIAPIRSMVRYILGAGLKHRVTVLASFKTPEDILFREEFERHAREGSIELRWTITRPGEASRGEAWSGPVGRIDLGRIKEWVPDLREACFYVCGPNSLVETVSDGLRSEGIPARRIKREKWGEF